MYRKYIIVFCLLFIALITHAYGVEVSAKSAVLYEVSSGKVLYQKDMNSRREIASTTKIMTALLAIERAHPDDVVKIKREYTGIEGTSLYLKPGEEITVRTLLHGLMLQSGNDAAVALAGHIAGGSDAFVEIMNSRAAQLGMNDTHFENPNGLPGENHYSTALDMAKLAAYAMEIEEFSDIVASKSYTAEGKSFLNHNKLLRMSERIDGVKTGFTKAAGRCLVSSAEEDGMRLVAVTLSAPDDWNDHLALYDYGFSAYKKHVFVQAEQEISEVPIIGGKSEKIRAVSIDELSAVLESDTSKSVHTEVYLPRFLYAPVKRSEVIGEIHLVENGKVVSKTDIISASRVEMDKSKTFWEVIVLFFKDLFCLK